MKKIFFVFILASALLCSCQKKEEPESSGYYSEISKAQEIAVISADTSRVIQTLATKDDIEDLVMALDMETWTLGELPKDAKEIGSFALSQEKTVRSGQTETDGELYDVCKISVYDEPYIKYEIAGASMVFEINEATADYLRGYFG